MNFNFSQIFTEMLLAAFNSQVTKASTWITRQVGHPTTAAGQVAAAIGSAALQVGAAAVAAKPDHPDLRAAAGAALDTLSGALSAGEAGSPALSPTEPAQ